MIKFSFTGILWGREAKLRYLLAASFLLLFSFLGGREIWTQEHRWATIVSEMFFRHDFLHPYIGEVKYYDKPLLSYWLIAIFSKVAGVLNAGVLRFPSALSGFTAVFSIYWLGKTIKDKQLGLLAGWLLLTTFYFVFWARISSADMLNLSGSLFATAWYYAKRYSTRFIDYLVFFLVLSITSLCKGLVGAVIPLIAVMTDIYLERSFKKLLHWQLYMSLLIAIILFLLPFVASLFVGGKDYSENGLAYVYRENVVRFLKPFDHQGSIFTYFFYLPIYLLPWSLLLLPTLFTLPKRWKKMTVSSKWLTWSAFFIFLFFTLSGSRRNYYILPLVPFMLIGIAEWAMSCSLGYSQRLGQAAALFSLLIFIGFDIGPQWYCSHFGMQSFANRLQKEMEREGTQAKSWKIVLLDAESKIHFYLHLPPSEKNYPVMGGRASQTLSTLLSAWPFLRQKQDHTIFITRKRYYPFLRDMFKQYRVVESPVPPFYLFGFFDAKNVPIALLPIES